VDPDPGRPKLPPPPPKKRGENEDIFEKFSIGLKTFPGAWMSFVGVEKDIGTRIGYMTVFDQIFLFVQKAWPKFGYEFSNRLDPDPD
jgi:hypothetical protein